MKTKDKGFDHMPTTILEFIRILTKEKKIIANTNHSRKSIGATDNISDVC